MISHQRKREIKFKEAVLRRLYPTSLSPPLSPLHPDASPSPVSDTSPSPVSAAIHDIQSIGHEAHKEQGNGENVDSSRKISDNEEEKASKTFLTRAQRKRLKLKRLKEAKAKIVAQPGPSIGPLLPDLSHTNDDPSAVNLDSNHEKQSIERKIDVDTECKDGCLLLSKLKRRKLAKRKFSHDYQSRRVSSVSVFTAVAGEQGFTIKSGPLIE